MKLSIRVIIAILGIYIIGGVTAIAANGGGLTKGVYASKDIENCTLQQLSKPQKNPLDVVACDPLLMLTTQYHLTWATWQYRSNHQGADIAEYKPYDLGAASLAVLGLYIFGLRKTRSNLQAKNSR